MAIKKSEGIAIIEGKEDLGLHRKKGRLKTRVDTVAVVAADIDNTDDSIVVATIPSNAVLMDVLLLNDDLDSGGTPALVVNIGLAYSGIGGTQKIDGRTSGEIIDADCFASLVIELQSPNVVWKSVRFEAADIAGADQEAWEVCGLSEDPGGLFYVVLDVTTVAATGADGDVVVRVDYI